MKMKTTMKRMMKMKNGKVICEEAARVGLEVAAVCFCRDYMEVHGCEPPDEMVEDYAKTRFLEFCEMMGIERVELDE